MGALKSRTNLGRLCSLAHKTRGVTEWLTMAAQIAEALCATCTELATEEEKTTCEKRLCHIDLPRHGMVSGCRCFLEKDLTSFMIKLMFKPEAFTFALI